MKVRVTATDPAEMRMLVKEPSFKALELYPAESDGHKFKAGDVCTLHGLIDFAEFNGQQVTVTAIREDGPKGKAYYVKGEINAAANWVYEYRLEAQP